MKLLKNQEILNAITRIKSTFAQYHELEFRITENDEGIKLVTFYNDSNSSESHMISRLEVKRSFLESEVIAVDKMQMWMTNETTAGLLTIAHEDCDLLSYDTKKELQDLLSNSAEKNPHLRYHKMIVDMQMKSNKNQLEDSLEAETRKACRIWSFGLMIALMEKSNYESWSLLNSYK